MRLSFKLPHFHCSDEMTRHLQKVFSGEYDVQIQFGFSPTILDLGANAGAFSVWALHRWPGAIIHAYEPHPENVKLFERNLEAYPNVFLYPFGVGKPGMRELYEGKNNEGEHSFHEMKNNLNLKGQEIEVKDPLNLPEADILKMDIEGCEFEVLSSLLEGGRKFSVILYEFHSRQLRQQCDSLLNDYILIDQVMANPERGVAKYLNKELYGG